MPNTRAVPAITRATIERGGPAPLAWPALVAALVAVLALAGASPAGAATGPGDARSGTLLLRMAQGYETATTLETAVDMQVSGLVARVSVRQRFENTGTDWAEGVYVFPLPETAAVDRLRLVIGERVIEGEIREREAARREYEQAKQAGQRASLVEQERPNLFTTSVANIAPGESVVVEIAYLEELRYADGRFSLRFPLTLTPRYMPGQVLSEGPFPDREGSGWSPDTSAVPDASRISPPVATASRGHTVTMAITLDAGLPLDVIASRYHPIEVEERQGRYTIELAGDDVPMDHDFELVWQPATGHAPQALVFTETVGGEPYYLLMLLPPTSGALPPPPREMIFIVDTSGSMHGTSIEQARLALLRALGGLGPQDRFNVIEFNSVARALFRTSVAASADFVASAERFVKDLDAEGGTEMRPALELALADPPLETHLRQVVFLTDGAVGNEDELFALIEARLGAGRLFTVGIGSAPNSWFMRKAAEAGRGTFTLISALGEVGEKMDRLFAKMGQPQVTGIRIDWPPGVTADAYPAVVPDLYFDEPVSVRAKLAGLETGGAATATVQVSGDTVGGAWGRELALATDLPNQPAAGVAALWARGRLDSLMDEERRGRDAESVRADVIATALGHGLVSRYTSLVAVDRTPARSAEARLRQDAVANRLPYGQSTETLFGFPATATDAAQLRQTGVAALLAALLMLWLTRRRPAARSAARAPL